jgi:ATP-dependent DNA ligase
VQAYLLEAFADGTEGLMLKRLDVGAAYQPSKRTESWIKIKRCVPCFLELPMAAA